MSDYELYYWSDSVSRPVRARRAGLSPARPGPKHGDAAISKLMGGPVERMPVPFMGPPVLIDKKAGFRRRANAGHRPLSRRDAGPAACAAGFARPDDEDGARRQRRDRRPHPRRRPPDVDAGALARVHPPIAEVDVALGGDRARHGLTAQSGFLLGGEHAGLADVATATLWSTMGERFHKIQQMLEDTAPATAALTRRVAALPPLAKLAAKAKQDYGEAYCGGRSRLRCARCSTKRPALQAGARASSGLGVAVGEAEGAGAGLAAGAVSVVEARCSTMPLVIQRSLKA